MQLCKQRKVQLRFWKLIQMQMILDSWSICSQIVVRNDSFLWMFSFGKVITLCENVLPIWGISGKNWKKITSQRQKWCHEQRMLINEIVLIQGYWNPLKPMWVVSFNDPGSFIANLMSFYLQCNLENSTLHCCLW